MKKQLFLLGLIGTLVFSLYLTVPVAASTSPCGWMTLPVSGTPVTDPVNDVVTYTNPANPEAGGYTSLYNKIDIVAAFINNSIDLVIEFELNPILSTIHNYTVLIDTNDDSNSDYNISSYGLDWLYMRRVSDNQYWNGTHWSVTVEQIPFNQSIGNYLVIYNVGGAVSLATAKMAIICEYIFNRPTTYHADFMPLLSPTQGNGGGIPGFPLLITLFSILTLMGLAFLRQNRRHPW